MVEIVNYSTYDTEMAKSMIDKLFFLDKVDASVFIDFGCADGMLFDIIAKIFPKSNYAYLGYDNDQMMVEAAFARNIPNANYTTNWEDVKDFVDISKLANRKTCLILNSLIHEIYSYGTEETIEKFWKDITSLGVDYVVIRDLCMDSDAISYPLVREIQEHAEMIRAKANPKQVEDFENIWGSLNEYKNQVHFLLKYRYTDNWVREVRENYFPYSLRTVKKHFEKNYNIDFESRFALPFNVKTIKKDFNIVLDAKTHVKLIFEKKLV